jgi:hypothetical protein
MSNSPFKMKGMSFGNSPLKDHKKGHTIADSFTRSSYYEKGYTDKKTKRKKNRKAFKFTKVGKFIKKITGGGGSRGGSSTKLGCGPGSCPS